MKKSLFMLLGASLFAFAACNKTEKKETDTAVVTENTGTADYEAMYRDRAKDVTKQMAQDLKFDADTAMQSKVSTVYYTRAKRRHEARGKYATDTTGMHAEMRQIDLEAENEFQKILKPEQYEIYEARKTAVIRGFAGFISACAPNPNTQEIYKPGREWIYKVSEISTDGIVKDTFLFPLKVQDGTFFLQTQIEYTITERVSANTVNTITETTGVVELKNKIWLHPFRSGKLRFTELAPFPEVRFPAEIGKTWNGKINIGPGWKELSGKKVSNSYLISDTTSIKTPFRNFKGVLKIDGAGKSELGTYKASHFFDKDYGFVAMHYLKPNGDKVLIELQKANF